MAGSSGTDNRIHADQQRPTLALVGHVNLIHPNSIQVFGLAEIQYLNGLGETDAQRMLDQLFALPISAIIVANDQPLPKGLRAQCEQHNVPLLTSSQPSPHLMDVMRIYLARVLAASTIMHGVFLDVLEVGVLITGESSMGKKRAGAGFDLARPWPGGGRRRRAVSHWPGNAGRPLSGRAARFSGSARAGHFEYPGDFGETAVRPKKVLKLIIHLVRPPINPCASWTA